MRNFIAILFLFLMFSCGNGEKVPEYVIPQDDMVNIIIDIHLTDGILTVSNVRRKLARQDTINFYDAIFENYGYKRSDFDTSIYYYSNHITRFDKIYEEVLNQLNEKETLLKEEVSKKDSLASLKKEDSKKHLPVNSPQKASN